MFVRGVIPLLMMCLAGCAGSVPTADPGGQPPGSPPLHAEESPPSPTASTLPEPVVPSAAAQSVFTISMPVYRQVMNLDCEAAALQMALASLGHPYSQPALFAEENADPRLPIMNPDRSVKNWGNPYVGFVGNVNGSDLAPTGYGVYYPVILAVARSHGAPDATGGERLSPADVYVALKAGRPVMVWVETGWERVGYPLIGTWIAWDGQPIHYSLIEHTVTLSGVSETQVRVNDPWHAGSQYWISKAVFEKSWRDFNNMAVIF
ncbi:MAG: hypothetical protein E6J01_05260 [Chloroflexi bacterium]|nr:MAG: hypothetical protein E6J01_05260 [Chloroflexota bacterium]